MSATTRIGLAGPMRAYALFAAKAAAAGVSLTVPYPEWALELYLEGAWVDVSDDLLDALTIEYGIRDNDPRERVATVGELTTTLDNSASNAAHTLGYYSPLSSSKRPGFDFAVPARFRLSYGTDSAYKFLGKLVDIDVVPGVAGVRTTAIKALDWMDEAARIDLPDIAAQLDQRDDQIVTSILDALDADDQPAARDIDTGLETFAIALDGAAASSQRPSIRDTLIQIARSSFGYGYVRGDSVQGGTFTWENRHRRAMHPDVLQNLTDDVIQDGGLAVPSSRDQIFSTVQVFVRPSRVDTSATTVLFSLQSASTLVNPGVTNTQLFGPYRDPSNNDQIGGTAQVDPVATTDYTMNSQADGLGTDLTSAFTVTASYSGLGVRFTITNNGTTAGYVTKLQLRGKGIYRYDAMIEVVVPGAAYGTQILGLEMTFQNDTNVGTDVANYLAQALSVPLARVQSVRFLANDSEALLLAAILREPGDRVSVSEVVTSIDHEFTINGVRLELQPGNLLYCTWWLETGSQRHWLWGVPGSSEWGLTTFYGF